MTPRDEEAMQAKAGKVKEIWGRQFRIVRKGLDEAEVVAFISRLIEQNSELSRKLEHVDSLKRLAENAVIEASKQAESIKIEAGEEADRKAEKIITQAVEQTKAAAKRIIAEAKKSSRDRIAASEQLAQDVLKKAERKAEAQAGRIIAEAEEKARARAERIIAGAGEKARAQAERSITEAEEKARAQAVKQTKAEAERIIAEAEKRSRDRIAASEQLAQDVLKAAQEKVEAQSRAEKLAQEELSLAERKAKDIVGAAEQRARDITGAAEQKAQEIRRVGEEEASRIVVEAKRKAEQEAAPVRREAGHLLLAGKRIAEGEIREVARRVLGEFLSSLEEEDEKEGSALYRGVVELAIAPLVAMSNMLRLVSNVPTTVGSILLTAIIIVVFVLIGPKSAEAVNVSLTPSTLSVGPGGNITFDVTVVIEDNERIPIHDVYLRIFSDDQCTIELTESPYDSARTMTLVSATPSTGYYGYGYQYGSDTNEGQVYYFGYGYGYGYDYGGPLTLLYRCTVDTTGWDAGVYYARGDVDSGTHTYSSSTVSLTVAYDWDVRVDGCINVLDLILVGQHWGETGAPGWIREDVYKKDGEIGEINISDLIVVGQHWREGCP
jgi:vacuolar-type H+-ATPase subunit H